MTPMELYLLLAIGLGMIPAAIAGGKGHSAFAWWIFGAALFIVALPCAILIKPEMTNARPCPHCQAMIPGSATACRHCTRDVTPLTAQNELSDIGG